MDTRGPRFTRRGALVATAATTLLALAALGGASASAAPLDSSPDSAFRVVSPGVTSVDVSDVIGTGHKAPVKVVMRSGSCSPEMMDP